MPIALTAAIVHIGLMDGSAGIAVCENKFITVSDEVNRIKRFSVVDNTAGEIALDLDGEKEWFQSRSKKNGFHEADIEGAARIGDVIYWISSHGHHEKAEKKQDRRVFFATKIDKEGRITPHGKVHRRLLADLLAEDSLKSFRLEEASGIAPKTGASENPPGGLNIESLCTAADGESLLIGFRNPVPGGKALVVPLKNPAELLTGTAKAKFGEAIELGLHGLGLRDMVRWRGEYLIIGGHYDSHLGDTDGKPIDGAPAPALFRWNEKSKDDPKKLDTSGLKVLNPEALIVFPDDRVLLLSDDGSLRNGQGVSQKDAYDEDPVKNPGTFRSVWLTGLE
jgi:hypothetical protein